MGKIRTRILGLEAVEEQQKKEQKKRAAEKKATKKIRAPGLKGGERLVEVGVDDASIKKMEKAKKIITEEPKKPAVSTVVEKKKVLKPRQRGANYKNAKNKVGKNKTFSIEDAVKLLKKIRYAKFDESVELHLNVDKVGLKGEVELPYSIGKKIRVAIIDDKLLGEIEKGKIDFDVLIAHPSFMPRLAKLAKILGPRGLMPNPKAGTISLQPETVAKKFEKGIIRWRTESKSPLIHQLIGKISYEDKKLIENAKSFLQSVGKSHLRSVFIKSTMSPSLKIAF